MIFKQGGMQMANRSLMVLALLSVAINTQAQEPHSRAELLRIIDEQRARLDDQQQQLDEQKRILDDLTSEVQLRPEEAEPDSGLVMIDPSSKYFDRGKDDRFAHKHPLDGFPTDVRRDRGLFVMSEDRSKGLRLYGSVRMLMVYDDRENFHAFDLNIPQVPTGEADSSDTNTEWNTEETRLGLDVKVAAAGGISMKMEFDRKGTNEKLRSRHAYMRTDNWLVGKNWSAFNSLPYLPLAVDGHSTGAAAGPRPDQIKYLNNVGDFRYELALENFQPDINAPATIEVDSRNVYPNFAGNLTYERSWGLVRIAGMAVPNRVRDDSGSQEELGYAWQLGTRYNLGDRHRIKAHVLGTSGAATYMADFTIDGFDMIYDPRSHTFKNINLKGGAIALEHNWTPVISTTVGGSYMDIDNRSFEEDLAFDNGYKALVNLFYKPKGVLDGLVIGAEVETAGRTNKDDTKSDTVRFSLLTYYDF
jgi:hypothetical protein